MYNTDKKVKVTIEGDDYSEPYRYYNPDHHEGPRHAKLEKDYYKWMKRTLHFRPEVRWRVDETLTTIGRKMDLKASSEVTFVGIHNRRNSEAVDHWKKYHGKKALKKSYFYDAMEEMRESYDNVAFLYVSDNMKWGRANIKDKENDLYFVGNKCTNLLHKKVSHNFRIDLQAKMMKLLILLCCVTVTIPLFPVGPFLLGLAIGQVENTIQSTALLFPMRSMTPLKKS